MTEVQGSQNDDESKTASTNTVVDNLGRIIEDKLSKRFSSLPEDYLTRHTELQRHSPFWTKLSIQTPGTNATRRSPLKSREWAEYVVDSSRIFFEGGLPVRKVVAIINYIIRHVTLCVLNGGEETIYFEDGRNVFYEPESGGMPEALKTKYKVFLRGMQATILESSREAQSDSEIELIRESGDESSAGSRVSRLKAAVTPPVEGAVMITSQEESLVLEGSASTSALEPSTAPIEAKALTLKAEKTSYSQCQAVRKLPQSKKARRNLKRKERNRALRAMLVCQGKIKRGKWWRKNQKRKEKKKIRHEAAGQTAGM